MLQYVFDDQCRLVETLTIHGPAEPLRTEPDRCERLALEAPQGQSTWTYVYDRSGDVCWKKEARPS